MPEMVIHELTPIKVISVVDQRTETRHLGFQNPLEDICLN